MSRAPSNFRQGDVTKAINAAKAAGLPIAKVEIDAKTGKIMVIVGEPVADDDEEQPKPNKGWEDAV